MKRIYFNNVDGGIGSHVSIDGENIYGWGKTKIDAFKSLHRALASEVKKLQEQERRTNNAGEDVARQIDNYINPIVAIKEVKCHEK